MSMIRAENLTFAYPASYDNIFEDVNFQIDTNWKLGLIGRNGRGKTTLLRLNGAGLVLAHAVALLHQFQCFHGFGSSNCGAAAARRGVANARNGRRPVKPAVVSRISCHVSAGRRVFYAAYFSAFSMFAYTVSESSHITMTTSPPGITPSLAFFAMAYWSSR